MRYHYVGAALLTACLATLATTSCSGGAAMTSMDPAVQAQLRTVVAALATDAAAHNTAAARAALATLDSDAAAAHTAGRLSDSKFLQIRATEAALQADFTASSAATPLPTSPGSTPAPTPSYGKSKGEGDGSGGYKSGGDNGGG